jgi:hypothetical protein
MPQGLKPIDFVGVIGTAEAVPCYKASGMELFRSQLRDFFAIKECPGPSVASNLIETPGNH